MSALGQADRTLAGRIERVFAEANASYAATYARLFPGEGAGWTAIASGGVVTFAGVGSPLSRATGLGMAGPISPEDLDQVEQYLVSRGAQPRVDLCPMADRTFAKLLTDRGYQTAYSLNINVLPLDEGSSRHQGTGLHRQTEQLTLARLSADDPSQAALWADTIGMGFADHGAASPDDRRIYLTTYASSACWLAMVDDEPAGGGALRLLGRTALLSTASTVPAYRRRGVQAALLLARLDAARAAGCDLAIVMTSPGSDSERNVTRLGFGTLYADAFMSRI